MGPDQLEALERLVRLREAGALSASEFETAKSSLLKNPSDRLADPVTETPVNAPAPVDEIASGPPVWARKRPPVGRGSVFLISLSVFAICLTAMLWALNRPADAEVFMTTGVANVRDAPSTNGTAVGRLSEGETITGRPQGEGETQWVEITEGPLKNRYVWAGNLVTEGPDEVLDLANERHMAETADSPPSPPVVETEEQRTAAMIQGWDCSALSAAVAASSCAATVMQNIPNSSKAAQMQHDTRAYGSEFRRRCSASRAAQASSGVEAILVQEVGEVYASVAPQAVYGGDLSQTISEQCVRRVMGRMAQAGLL